MAKTVAVVGLGKIGLPLAAQLASKGMTVIGCDTQPDVIERINSGHAHIREEAGLEEAVAAAVKRGTLCATLDTTAAVKKADVIVVIVPLMVGPSREPDYANIDVATRAIGRGLHRDALVIYETTLPVGTTRGRLGPMLEEASRMNAGRDFQLAFSPERLYTGRVFEDLRKYPKIVGGVDANSTEAAVKFYRSALDAEVWPVESAETAEFVKLAETTYRDVNIALANQLALYGARHDVNVSEAFQAANSQPYSHLHRPSIGVGGHCIPVYPHFLLGDAGNGELSLVREGRRINDRMAELAVAELKAVLGDLASRRVLVLGASYREDVKELAFSTAFSIVDLLGRAGAQVMLHDPHFRPQELARFEAEVVELDSQRAAEAEAVVVQAWHSEFRDLDWHRFRHLHAVLDGRGSLDAQKVREVGATYIAIGNLGSRAGAPK